jgi:glycosyltransferase involved in cell wall biosynthesis
MKISLITPSYNSAATIVRTINSIIAQNYSDLEYIVIDGGSTDDTAKIISSYQNKININFISEPDNGIYDAMNKGIKMASGDIVGILNSDDLFSDNDILSTVANTFANNQVDIVYGDIKYFSDDPNKITRYWKSGEYKNSKLNNGWVIPHPALFVKKTVYDLAGLYDSNFRIAGDYEFILRILKKHNFSLKYIPKVFVKMFAGGVSGRDLEHRKRGWNELKKAWVINDLKTPRFFILRRLLFKVSQLITKK